MERREFLAIALVLWFTVSFALTNSMAGLAYKGGADPLTVATARFIVPTLVLALALWVTGARFALPKSDAIAAVTLGLITAGFSFSILNAIEILGVSLAVLIFFLFPLFTSLIVAVMGWEKLTATTVIAGVVAFAGLALIFGVNGESLALLGIIYALVGAFGLALVSAVSSRVIRSGDSRQVTFYIVSTAAVVFIAFSLILNDPQLPETGSGWVGIAGTSVFYACGIIGYFVAIAKIGPAKATLYSYVEPLFTMFAAYLFLDELLAPLQIVGALIVVGALTATGVAGLRKR
ncbi:MAG: drug/metabolite transporter (DMT)-like permease [Alphaproteobacteria bacterium]|jgi:drug/metabolite transporter (DMT)-like permease